MIFVDRSKVAVPLVFTGESDTMTQYMKDTMTQYMKEGEAFAKDKSIEAPPDIHLTEMDDEEVVLLLTILFDNKCAYCESLILEHPFLNERHMRKYTEFPMQDWTRGIDIDPMLIQQIEKKYSPLFDNVKTKFEDDEYLQRVFERTRRKDLAEISRFDVSTFRPISWAKDEYGRADREHYWWLLSDWNNFYLCCENCSDQKGDRFPVQGKRISRNQAIEEEKAMLLDPCKQEDMLNHIAFEGPEAIPLTERGALSIDVFGLNRPRLVENRSLFLMAANKKIEAFLLESDDSSKFLQYEGQLLPSYYPYLACLHSNLAQSHGNDAETLLKLTHVLPGGLEVPSQEESLTAEDSAAYYRDSLQSKENKEIDEIIKSRGVDTGEQANEIDQSLLKEVLEQQRKKHYSSYSLDDLDSEEDQKAYFRKSRWISKIEIQNFKNIRNLTLEFPTSGGLTKGQEKKQPWLVILGENGVGKSSILQATAMTLMGQKRLNEMEFNAAEYVTRGVAFKESKVEIYLTDRKNPITLTIHKETGVFNVDPPEPQVLLMGYGATRLLTKDKEKELNPDFIRVKNLFDPFVQLDNVQKWLQNEDQVDEGLFEVITKSLLDLMMLKGQANRFSREKLGNGSWRILFEKEPGNKVPLDYLSDGYKSVIALALDILVGLYQVYGQGEKHTRLKEAEGIALIDEIGVHLHPQWKMWIVGALRRAFPKMNFIVTTHEPLCLRGLEKGEVYVAKLGEEHQMEVITEGLPSPKDLRVDQLLTSSFFGLNSVLDPEVERKFDRYYELQAMGDKLTPAQQKEKEQLEPQILERKVMLGSTLQEEIDYQVIKEKFKHFSQQEKQFKPEEVQEEIITDLKEKWDDALFD